MRLCSLGRVVGRTAENEVAEGVHGEHQGGEDVCIGEESAAEEGLAVVGKGLDGSQEGAGLRPATRSIGRGARARR